MEQGGLDQFPVEKTLLSIISISMLSRSSILVYTVCAKFSSRTAALTSSIDTLHIVPFPPRTVIDLESGFTERMTFCKTKYRFFHFVSFEIHQQDLQF